MQILYIPDFAVIGLQKQRYCASSALSLSQLHCERYKSRPYQRSVRHDTTLSLSTLLTDHLKSQSPIN